jgi:hypothetical protein
VTNLDIDTGGLTARFIPTNGIIAEPNAMFVSLYFRFAAVFLFVAPFFHVA